MLADPECKGTTGKPPCDSPIHADQHAIAFGASGSPRPLYLGNDGGIVGTTNGNAGTGVTWNNLNGNLATTQFYAGDAANNYLTNPVVVAGAQDNGTARSATSSLAQWGTIQGGDGGYVAVDKTDANTVYAEYVNGNLFKTAHADAGTSITWTYILPVVTYPAPTASTVCSQAGKAPLFIAPFTMDPQPANHNHLVFGGYGDVCETIDGGTSWAVSNASLPLGQAVQSVTIASANAAYIYAGTSGGQIVRTTNGNTGAAATWSQCNMGNLSLQPVTAIAVDTNDANTIYFTYGGFGSHHVYKMVGCPSTTAAATWTDISGSGVNLLPDVPVNSIVEYPSTTSTDPALIIGTDIGVFVTTNNGSSWSQLQTGLPNVPVDMLFTDRSYTTLFAATHGRGMWQVAIPAGSPPSIAFNPSSLDFGTQRVGTTATKTITVTNNGQTDLNISAVSFAAPSVYSPTGNTCVGTAVHAGQSCSVTVQFAPTLDASYTGTMNFTDDASGSPQQVAITGIGSTGLTFSPGSINFGSRQINTTSAAQTVTVTNSGTAAITFSTVALSASGSGVGFGKPTDTCSNHTLQPNGQCSVSVTFDPPSVGEIDGRITFNNNTTTTTPFVSLTGTGTNSNAPVVGATPNPITFGNVTYQSGQFYADYRYVKITNTGNQPMILGANAIEVDSNSSNYLDFNVNQDACSGKTLQPGQYCIVYVQFNPKAAGARSTNLLVYSNALPNPTMIPMSGTGVTSGVPALNIHYVFMDFGNQDIATQGPKQMSLFNSGAAAITISALAFTNDSLNAADFSFTNECVSITLQPGQQCLMSGNFQPRAAGNRTATLQITDNDGGIAGSTQMAYFTGNGIAVPLVNVSPTSLTFGNQNVNATSAVEPVTIRNYGAATLTINSITTNGDFAQTNNCGAALGGGATCTINVTFTPTAKENRTGTLTVADNNNYVSSTQTVNLSGVGVIPPPRITKLSTRTGSTTQTTPVTITGANFQQGVAVYFGGVQATITGTPTSTSISVTVPAHSEGMAEVDVINPDGQSAALDSSFAFVPPGFVPNPGTRPSGTSVSGPPPPSAPAARPPGVSLPSGSPPAPLPGSR